MKVLITGASGYFAWSKNVPVNVLYKFVENSLDGKDINIQGGKQNFSFIDVRDVADVINVSCEQWETTYNLESEMQTNIVDLAKITVDYAVSVGKSSEHTDTGKYIVFRKEKGNSLIHFYAAIEMRWVV